MEWFEDESFWRDYYPFMIGKELWSAAEAQVNAVLRLSGVGDGRVLDLCCGSARCLRQTEEHA